MTKAIINSGSRKLIGEVEDHTKPGDLAVVKDAYELRCDMFLVQTPQGPIGLHKNTIVAVDAEEEGVDISCIVDNIRWFSSMSDKGRKYEAMLEEFQQILIQNRANRAGIEMASNMPKENSKKSNIII